MGKKCENSKDKMLLTPSYYGVPVEVSSLRKEGLYQQCEEIQSFNEQPEIVRHDTVMEENHHCFTGHLHRGTQEGGAHERSECRGKFFYSCRTILLGY